MIVIFLQAIEGLILRAVAELLGVPVTSWIRSPARNAQVGGKPTSFHLSGGAIDTPLDLAPWQRWVLRRVAREVPEPEKNHLHYQVDGRVWRILAKLPGEALKAARDERAAWGMHEPDPDDPRPL